MDKSRLCLLTAVIALTLFSVTKAAEKPLFRALSWLEDSPSARFEALGKNQIVRPAEENGQSALYATGRALFQTPVLLGGQAAKAGLSCESCHQGGTTNPHFLFPGMSDRPGTADVTHSFFSKLRGNGSFDPIPIPDLTYTGKVSHEGNDLEIFIRGLIVEEFGGAEPEAATLDALAYYVRNLQGAKKLPPTPHRVAEPLNNISTAVSQAKTAVNAGQIRTAKLLIASARHQLSLIHERYAATKNLKRHRKTLVTAGLALGTIQNQLKEEPARVSSALLRWDKLFVATEKRLKRGERKSLYNPVRLKKALRR